MVHAQATAGGARGARPRPRLLDRPARRGRGRDGAERLGQEHAATPPRRARRPDAGRRAGRGVDWRTSARPRGLVPPPRVRVRPPVAYSVAQGDGGGERRGAAAARPGRARRRAQRRVEAALERVGLADDAPNCPTSSPAAQQQRVAIARALVPNPAVLLADEPTGSLDSETAAVVIPPARRPTARERRRGRRPGHPRPGPPVTQSRAARTHSDASFRPADTVRRTVRIRRARKDRGRCRGCSPDASAARSGGSCWPPSGWLPGRMLGRDPAVRRRRVAGDDAGRAGPRADRHAGAGEPPRRRRHERRRRDADRTASAGVSGPSASRPPT